ncbi:MAG: hypothetical protein AAGD01_05055 [Acidobacteriota bacterium]
MARRTSILLAVLCLVLTSIPAVAAQQAKPIEGWLSILWGDYPSEAIPAHRKLILATDAGESVELRMSDELLQGGVFRWNNQRVRVYPAPGENFAGASEIQVGAIQLIGTADAAGGTAEIAGGISGSQPWISLLCKYSDVAAEPRDLAYFQGMYANSPGGVDHYWREVSLGEADVLGSMAIDWVTLPGTQASYVPTPGSGTSANLNAIFNDCTAAVDDVVDFGGGGTPFVGINLMINDLLDCCAWGGSRFTTLDGITKSWRTTWNPPWAFTNVSVIAHEMGHGFGLPHANNFDGDSNPYDSPWDVMSSSSGYSTNDPVYGNRGKHINAYHKDRLGWFPGARRFQAPDNSQTTIELDHTAISGASNYQIAIIPISATHWYTVEARLRTGDYEASLPGNAVIIHEVRTNRSEPSWAVDEAVPPANYGDNDGTMWVPGETFEDVANNISVTVESATANGFEVTIENDFMDEVFVDGFETGDTSQWTVPDP